MYDVKSKVAEEFIDDGEIVETMEYARANRHNRALIEHILDKAEAAKGITHREAAVLLECDLPDLNERMFALARRLKERIYGNRIVMFAPLYLSNYCINGCTYCPYHAKNKTMLRKQLSQKEIETEVIALQDMGHKRLALEAGEHPLNSIEYILESIRTIYNVKHKNGAIRRVNVNIAATTVENYRKLAEAGIGTYILFQETYNKENYQKLHPYGPKSNYAYHTEAMDRAMEGASTTWASECCSALRTISTTSSVSSCMPNTSKRRTAWDRTPSAYPVSARPTTSTWPTSRMRSRTKSSTR